MNFVRRRPGNDRDVPSGIPPECAHLGRLFNQYKQIQDYAEQEQMFYELLPLFHGVLADCQPTEFVEKFPDVHSFCARASQILVREVKLRAAKQTSEEGSRNIAIYFSCNDIDSSVSNSSRNSMTPLNVEHRGWNLLLCLNLLSTGHTSFIECMVAASLPSTMVKCMYIFLDLPQNASHLASSFQPTFKQLLQRLCLYPITAEELARNDALCHLFSASADWCSIHNVIWRSTTATVLSTVAQNGLTSTVVKYIHESKCIVDCLKNISQGRLVPLEVLDSFVALLHVLRESFVISHTLMDDFRSNNGYLITTEFILKFEQSSCTIETKQALQTLITLVGRLVVCGAVELRPKPGAGEQIHVMPGFRVPMPKTGAKKSVRNIHAFDVLQSVFLSAFSSELCLVVLDTIRGIYLQDLSNYFILEQQNTLVVFAKKIFHKPIDVQEAFFNLLEVLVNKLHYVPMKEISSIVVLLKTCHLTSCITVTLRHLIRLVREYRTFKEVFNDVGLLELGVELLHEFADNIDKTDNAESMKQDCRSISNGSLPAPLVTPDIGNLVLDFLKYCVAGNVANADLCVRLGTAECLVNRVLSAHPNNSSRAELRRSALLVLEELILTNGGEELMPSLLSKMHTTSVTLKVEILRSFCRVLRESHRCRIIFRKVNGFVYVMQEVIYLEGCLDPSRINLSKNKSEEMNDQKQDQTHPDSFHFPKRDCAPLTRIQFLASLSYKQVFHLIRSIFTTFGIAMKFEPANAHYFATEIQFSNLTDAVVGLGSFASETTGERVGTLRSTCSDSSTAQENPFFGLFRNARFAETVLINNIESLKSDNLPDQLSFHDPCSSTSDPTTQIRQLSRRAVECCILARYMYDLAIDGFDRHTLYTIGTDRPILSSATDGVRSVSASSRISETESSIVHPGAIISILHMVAMLDQQPANNACANSAEEYMQLQFCLLDVISQLLSSERNQQLMCSVAMPCELLTLFRGPLAYEASPLHSRIQSLFESLVTHALTPNDLRTFLRISNPLCCLPSPLVQPTTELGQDPLREIATAVENARCRHGGPVPLSQIKCLITTSTPTSAHIARPLCGQPVIGTENSNPNDGDHLASEGCGPTEYTMSFAAVPPFVEFDMAPEGFGCLFLPSIAPQGPSSVSNITGATTTSDLTSSAGGVGSGERVFPPPHGLTFSTWLCVLRFDRFRPCSAALPVDSTPIDRPRRGSSPNQPQSPSIGTQNQLVSSNQPQAVHLLTIVRGIQSVNDQLICLRIFIHPRSRMLVVSTQEKLAQPDRVTDYDLISGSASSEDIIPSLDSASAPSSAVGHNSSGGDTGPTGSFAVFPCGLQPGADSQEWPIGVWRHLAVVFSRAGMIKSSSCSVYLDGRLVGVQRLNYIGTSAASSGFLGRQTMPSSVCAFVGTPASMRRPSALVWRQGPMHLIEEPLSSSKIAYIALLGPNYIGSFQSPPPVSCDVSAGYAEPYHPLFSEEKLVFGIYASTLSTFTLSLLRKVYNQVDAKAIARQFYIAPKENATPIRLLHNSAAHLQGPARPLGAILVGYQGVRAFAPSPVVRQLHCIGGGVGGIRIGLALVAMAQDVETLYAATKAACTLIKCSPIAANEMSVTGGYEILAMLLRKKRSLLTTRILDSILGLTLSLDSWIDATYSLGNISPMDHPAFEYLMCDLDLWRVDTERSCGSETLATCGPTVSAVEKRSVTMDVTSSAIIVESDYRLVANMLNHLVELLGNDVRRSAEETSSLNTTHEFRNRKASRAMESIHPIWNVLFDRVICILMNSHSNPMRTSASSSQSDCRLSNASTSSVVVTIGRGALVDSCMHFLHTCLLHSCTFKWLLRLGKLMAWTLPTPDVDESGYSLENLSLSNELHSAEMLEWQQQLIVLRNRCFQLLIQCIVDGSTLNRKLCNDLVTVLGFDWLHQFLRPAVHSSTVVLAFHLLILLVLNPSYAVISSTPVEDWSSGFSTINLSDPKGARLGKNSVDVANDASTYSSNQSTESDGLAAYRIGCPAGRWLRGCETLLRQQHGLFLDTTVRQTKRTSSRLALALRELRLETCQQPGFAMLQTLLPHHAETPELFYLVVALLLQIPIRHVPTDFKLEYEALCSLASGQRSAPSRTSVDLCTNSACTDDIQPVPSHSLSNTGVSGLVSSFLSSAGLSVGHFGRRRTRTESNSEGPGDMAGLSDSFTSNQTSTKSTRSTFCPEAATLLVCLIRSLVASNCGNYEKLANHSGIHWNLDYPDVMLRFCVFLYQSKPLFRPIAMGPDFVNALVGLLQSASVNVQITPTESVEHPNRSVYKLALGFLQTIVTDGFLEPPTFHQPIHLVDTLLESWSDLAGSKQYQEFQTRLLCDLMSHFVAIDILNHRLLPIPPDGDATHLPPNLVYFATRIVDKLWQGYFSGEILKVIDFLIYCIDHWHNRAFVSSWSTQSSLIADYERFNLNSLYRSLNRAVLYQLSRPILTRSDQQQVLELFTRLANPSVTHQLSKVGQCRTSYSLSAIAVDLNLPGANRAGSLLFSDTNEDPEFPPCLVHLLMQLVRSDLYGPCPGVIAQSQSFLLQSTSPKPNQQHQLSPDVETTPQACSDKNTYYYYHTTFGVDEFGSDNDDELACSSSNNTQKSRNSKFRASERYRRDSQFSRYTSPRRPSDPLCSPSRESPLNSRDANNLTRTNVEAIVQASLKLWAECYLAKKAILAQLVPESQLVSGRSIPTLTDWAPVLESPCLMSWAQYVDSEAAGLGGIGPDTYWGRIPGPPVPTASASGEAPTGSLNANETNALPSVPSSSSGVSSLQHQFSLRLSRLPSSMFRLGSVTSSAPTSSVSLDNSGSPTVAPTSTYTQGIQSSAAPVNVSAHRYRSISPASAHMGILETAREAVHAWMPMQLNFLREFMEKQKRQYNRNMGFIQRQLELEWERVEQELTRERGLWGPTEQDPLARWKLDATEGPCRMRKRMIPNPLFYSRYPYHPWGSNRSTLSHGTTTEHTTPILPTAKCRHPRSRYSRLQFLNYRSHSIMREDWGPLTPWLSVLQETRNKQPRPLSVLSQSELGDSEAADTVETGDVKVLTTAPEPSEVFDAPDDATSQTLDPDEMEQSLQQTASLLRRASKLPSSTDIPKTDDLDELIASTGSIDQKEEKCDPSLPSDATSLISRSGSEPSPGPTADTNDGTLTQKNVNGPTNSNTLSGDKPQQYASVVIDEDEQLASHEAILRLLEPGERPAFMYRCARVFGLDVHEGLLLFGRAHFYVIDGYTLINTREIVDIDSLPPDIVHEPIVPCIPNGNHMQTIQDTQDSHSNTNKNRSRTSKSYLTDLWSTGAVSQTSGKQYFKFPYENIQDVLKRRYLLQPIALEVFNTDGRNFLLVFSRGLQNKVYQRFQDVAAGHSAPSQALLGQKNSHGLFSSFLGEKTVTQRWERGEMSNFQYLMYLNTQAGRSYNDLMQYPIFPWVLADYDSGELDLSRPETFRDFSKPMGAQTTHRLSQFERRYNEWDDPSGETPPYYYGTHYSSAMIVASYLVRVEPFTQQFLRLQGGHFDLPDRMFHSVKDAWLSASKHNMADVRELIPEFFYLPDFLVNSNGFDLGVKQNGTEVDNVALPPWAKSDPREFIRAHREALESEYVSAHLHEWIDLIFGYKQQGESAVQAHNVFHHLFYEGNVDIYSIDDPLRRSAVIGFINNFGQIPKQLFRKPHPSRRLAIPRAPAVTLYLNPNGRRHSGSQLAIDLFYRNLDCLRPHMQPLKELKHAVGQIMQPDPSLLPSGVGATGSSNTSGSTVGAGVVGPILGPGTSGGSSLFGDTPVNSLISSTAVGTGGSIIPGGPIVAVEQNKCLLPLSYAFYVAWGFTDGSLRLGSVFDPCERARCVFEMVDPGEILCCTAPNKRTLVTAGISTVVRIWKIQPIDATCPEVTSSGSGGVGGSSSGTGNSTGSSSGGSSSGSSSNSSQSNSGYCLRLRANLCGHTEAVTCLAASNAFNLVVSGSRDRTCILWDLTRLCFLRQLTGHTAPVAAVTINEATGDIATCGGTYLHLWNCNGEPIASVDALAGRNKQILCVCMSTLYDWDPDNVILTGGSDGVVRMWSLDYVRSEGTSIRNESESVVCSASNELQETGSTEVPFNDCDLTGVQSVNTLKAGDLQDTSWARQLTLRGKLTMHTAYSRSDNQQPAAVTALAISRDHRSVLVGDSRGRVHAWSVPTETARGGMTDQWIKDENATNCATDSCGVRFSLTERKHHCRNCGKVFCSKCSRFEIEIYRLRLFKRVRVCQGCYTELKIIQAPKTASNVDSRLSISPELERPRSLPTKEPTTVQSQIT